VDAVDLPHAPLKRICLSPGRIGPPMAKNTRTAILDAAEELIQIRGANGISYASISGRVKIRKASIHHHFPTKEVLVEEIVRRYSERFFKAVDTISASKASAPKKLRRYADLFDATLRAAPGKRVCLCGMLGAEFDSLSPRAAVLLREFYQQNEARLAAILAEGRRDGSLKFEGDPRTVGLTLFSMLEGAMFVARADGGTRQFKKLSKRALTLVGG
jgi:TetR/AcrR family transcriptional repressor of nem operon